MKITSLPIIMAIIICATVIILFIVACVHDTIIKTINARSMAKFNKAFPTFKENNAANAIIESEYMTKYESAKVPEASNIDFPETNKIETRPSLTEKYH